MKKRKQKETQVHKPLFLYGKGGMVCMSFSARDVAISKEIARRIGEGENVKESPKTLMRTIAYWSAQAQTADMESFQWHRERDQIMEAIATLTRFARGEDT